jgi:hypothetical protein
MARPMAGVPNGTLGVDGAVARLASAPDRAMLQNPTSAMIAAPGSRGRMAALLREGDHTIIGTSHRHRLNGEPGRWGPWDWLGRTLSGDPGRMPAV